MKLEQSISHERDEYSMTTEPISGREMIRKFGYRQCP
jgi:hypothetical protein